MLVLPFRMLGAGDAATVLQPAFVYLRYYIIVWIIRLECAAYFHFTCFFPFACINTRTRMYTYGRKATAHSL